MFLPLPNLSEEIDIKNITKNPTSINPLLYLYFTSTIPLPQTTRQAKKKS